jgi:uncharacterized protein (DUF1499 family)
MKSAQHHKTRLANWSLRLVLLALQLAFVTVVLHRFTALPTAVAVNLFLVSFAAAAMAALGAVASLSIIWHTGHAGALPAAFALAAGCGLLLVPTYYLPQISHTAPADVATVTVNPPEFRALRNARLAAGIEASERPVLPADSEQTITTIVTDHAPAEVFDLANDVIHKLDLNIVSLQAPGFDEPDGTIEATERTVLLGLTDDISLRVSPQDGLTKVDIRSSARYPRLDLGRNASRLHLIMRKLQASIDASLPGDATGSTDAVAADEAAPATKPDGTSAAATAPRRKRRVPAPADAPNAPALTTSRH